MTRKPNFVDSLPRVRFLPKNIFNAFPHTDAIFKKVDCGWWTSW
jgi:hypothetical protein